MIGWTVSGNIMANLAENFLALYYNYHTSGSAGSETQVNINSPNNCTVASLQYNYIQPFDVIRISPTVVMLWHYFHLCYCAQKITSSVSSSHISDVLMTF